MASDILLYSADFVPTGEDQKQHVELARDVADRFNNLYGKTFVVPRPLVREVGARIMSLQDPNRKMSKSEESSGSILLLDSEDQISTKVKQAMTDSGAEVQSSDDKPALTNLLQIYSAITKVDVIEIEKKYAGKGYGDFKKDLAQILIGELMPLQKRFRELMSNEEKLKSIIADGARKASAIANPKLAEVKEKIGLL
jgi:tryptophanyl-tRNA synthetase